MRLALGLTAALLAANVLVACSSATLVGPAVALDRAELSIDGRSVVVYVVGAPPASAGEACYEEFALGHETAGDVLHVTARQVAYAAADCRLDHLVCCDHALTIALATGVSVSAVADDGRQPSGALYFLSRPSAVRALVGLPDEWQLQQEYTEWGSTWVQRYSPYQPTPYNGGPFFNLEYRTTVASALTTDPEATISPATVNGQPAQVVSYQGAREVSVEWLAGDVLRQLITDERNFDAVALLALASSVAN